MAAASSFSSASDAAFDVPRAFGRLVLLKLIARGGMGDVYLAATTGIEGAERPCVVKTIRRDHIHDGSFLARFLDEARVQSQLSHPGVAQVLEAATDEKGEPFSVVEYVEGRSLADLRNRATHSGTKIGWPEAVAITLEMTNALAHVHERAGADGTPLGIVHRDLSPQNVMIGYSGEVKLIDFGTARGHNRRCHTVAGVVFAKPGYVAPEVARQQVGDGRIDLYAVGIMLWELCAGRRYLNGDPQKHLEEAAAGTLVVPPLAEDLDAPPMLDDVIDFLTKSEPDDRYASASLAAVALGKLLGLAPAGKNGERTVRGRIASLMHMVWPHEPGRSRAEFSKLLKESRGLARDSSAKLTAATPVTPEATEHAEAMKDGVLAGTAYKLVAKIGEGASGEVWSAEHLELGRKVAIKLLAPEHASAKDAIDRFRREARAVAALSHPNLVQLYDFGKAKDGRVYLAMELLDGEPLDKVLRKPISWKAAVGFAIQAAHALEAAHAAGLVHRDLKPANLFVTQNETVKLLDFGVAMALSDVPGHKKQKGFAIFGTPEYMAPEQVQGEAVDARCDVYSLGCVLYEMISGSPPFSGRSSVEVLGKQVRESVVPPTTRAPARGIPEALEDVVLKAMSKNKAERYPSAIAMRRALEEALAADAPKPAPKKRSMLVRGIALCGATLAIILVSHAGSRSAPTPSDVPAELAARPVETASAVPAAPDPAPTTLQAPFVTPASNNEPVATGDKPPKQDRAHEKLAAARAAAREKPDDPKAMRAWVHAALRAGDFRDARRAVDTWILHDSSPEPRIALANVLEASGKRSEARAVLEGVLETNPDSEPARKLHAKLGQPLPPADTVARRKAVAERE
ncbi:MAG TPA: protein kinase [Polyangiaceae bacterium]|jgi:serine/threonine-protein kinase